MKLKKLAVAVATMVVFFAVGSVAVAAYEYGTTSEVAYEYDSVAPSALLGVARITGNMVAVHRPGNPMNYPYQDLDIMGRLHRNTGVQITQNDWTGRFSGVSYDGITRLFVRVTVASDAPQNPRMVGYVAVDFLSAIEWWWPLGDIEQSY